MISHNNPGKGWYRIFEFKAEDEINPKELFWSLSKEEKVVLAAISLESYRDKKIDDKAVECIKKIFEFFVENKKSIILRFCYDRVGKGMEKEPAFLERILEHMETLGPILRDYLPWIVQYQGLFIGNYGEMHGSKFLSEDEIKSLYKTMKKYLPRVYFAVRTPEVLSIVKTDEYDTIFNDGLLGSHSHLGTIKENEVIPVEIKNTLVSGEVLSIQVDEQDFTANEIINVMEDFGISFLNSTYDNRRLEDFKEKGIYDEISRRLGYCLEITRIKNGFRHREVELKNEGFGPCKREILVVAENSAGQVVFKQELNTDRMWKAGEKKKISWEKVKSQEVKSISLIDKITGENIQIYNKNQPLMQVTFNS